ncbi:MAG: hypothetical protein J5759_02695 [Bacteroidales bacterium]|nr:hypothetical protein [Bacteroidales bacterium]
MKWLHNLLKGASLTTALFIFQACYGSPQNIMEEDRGEAPMTFVVHSRTSGSALEGIRIFGQDRYYENGYRELGVTGADGSCKVNLPYLRNVQGPYVRFEDPQGNYEVKDTVLFDLRERAIDIKLNDKL